MYTYEKFNFRLFPWFLMIIAGVLGITGLVKEAIIAGAVGIVFSFSYSGFKIDPDTLRIRKYDRFLWFYLGEWKPIPRPMYVTVVRIRLSNSRNSPLPFPTRDDSSSSVTYKMNLIVDNQVRFISLARGKREKMLIEGLKVARTLHIKLLDHTTIEKHWTE